MFNRSTQLTLFAAGLMLGAIFVFYLMLLAETGATAVSGTHLLLLLIAAFAAFFVSNIIIDQVLNPIRTTVSKIKEIGDMNFAEPLVIDSDDEELREYAFQFNEMAKKLNQYIKKQKQFVSDASHELSTPITIINGHADLLLRHGKQNPIILENSLTTIKQEALRMSQLVESLLSLAKSDSGQEVYNFTKINITTLLKESIKEMQLLAPDFTLKLKTEEQLTALCDGEAIRRVLRILLTNAVRYAEKGKLVEVGGCVTHGFVEVYVKDNGIGIPENHLPHIFGRFYRVDASRAKKTGSSGLGLAIAKEIIDAHGGEISAYSVEGTEIKFRISS